MKVVLAFDSFKGSLDAVAVCTAAAFGLARLTPMPEVVRVPLSDGGEGFAQAMLLAGGGEARELMVSGPLLERTRAQIVLLDAGGTAVLESAQACGLGLVPTDRRSPLRTTTYGLGEMLAGAEEAGAERAIVGLGGSATNDAGLGLLAALDWQFLDDCGDPLPPVGASLGRVARIIPGRRPHLQIIAACDVTNPLYGPHGAAHTYAPQKGASAEDIEALDRGLRHFADVSAALLGRDDSSLPGAGAAGGLGFALLAFLGAEFRPGAELAIELSRLDDHLNGADLCLTGEGQTDGQTACGKLPAAVAARCAHAGVPCVCLSGALGEGWRALYDCGMTAVLSISQRPQELSTAITSTPTALADAAEAVGRIVGGLISL
ncbi:MAG TPA: glycerate kinase [Armatimonadota bacterium]|jgi:glycerate kinase